MNIWMKVVVVALLAIAVGAVVVARRFSASPRTVGQNKASAAGDQPCCSAGAGNARASAATTQPIGAATPRLLDLGATQCIPCKMMAPILEELKKECAGRMQVDFIDVWQNPPAGQQYGIDSIPTQIFFDASGKELYRHQGFMPKEDILAKCKELGFALP